VWILISLAIGAVSLVQTVGLTDAFLRVCLLVTRYDTLNQVRPCGPSIFRTHAMILQQPCFYSVLGFATWLYILARIPTKIAQSPINMTQDRRTRVCVGRLSKEQTATCALLACSLVTHTTTNIYAASG
jgi:hypothetical protein